MNVWLAKDVQKQYKKLPKQEQAKIRKRLDILSQNSYAGKKLEGILKERRSMRAWPYRIIYSINKSENKIYISDILNRQGAYK